MMQAIALFAAALIWLSMAAPLSGQADRLPPWRTQMMPWLTHAGQPRPWRTDARLAAFNEPGYPDDFQVSFAGSDSVPKPELMWVTITAYDATSDLYLGVLINEPYYIRDVSLGENVVFRISVANSRPVAMRVNGRFEEAGWPASAAPTFFAGLREGIRAYRNGHDGNNMPEIEHCITALTPLMKNAPVNVRKDELFVGHFVLGRCLAEKYVTDQAISEFRAAIALDTSDVDSHMALLAELSVMTHRPAGELTPADRQRWDQQFLDELAIARRLAASDQDVGRVLDMVFDPSNDQQPDSLPASERARRQRFGYAFFRWKRR